MTPIERAARAIAAEIGMDPDQIVTAEEDAHVGLGLREPHPAWTRFVGTARVALQAVREPSDKMCDAAYNLEIDFASSSGSRGRTDGLFVWQTMIDAALEES